MRWYAALDDGSGFWHAFALVDAFTHAEASTRAKACLYSLSTVFREAAVLPLPSAPGNASPQSLASPQTEGRILHSVAWLHNSLDMGSFPGYVRRRLVGAASSVDDE